METRETEYGAIYWVYALSMLASLGWSGFRVGEYLLEHGFVWPGVEETLSRALPGAVGIVMLGLIDVLFVHPGRQE